MSEENPQQREASRPEEQSPATVFLRHVENSLLMGEYGDKVVTKRPLKFLIRDITEARQDYSAGLIDNSDESAWEQAAANDRLLSMHDQNYLKRQRSTGYEDLEAELAWAINYYAEQGDVLKLAQLLQDKTDLKKDKAESEKKKLVDRIIAERDGKKKVSPKMKSVLTSLLEGPDPRANITAALKLWDAETRLERSTSIAELTNLNPELANYIADQEVDYINLSKLKEIDIDTLRNILRSSHPIQLFGLTELSDEQLELVLAREAATYFHVANLKCSERTKALLTERTKLESKKYAIKELFLKKIEGTEAEFLVDQTLDEIMALLNHRASLEAFQSDFEIDLAEYFEILKQILQNREAKKSLQDYFDQKQNYERTLQQSGITGEEPSFNQEAEVVLEKLPKEVLISSLDILETIINDAAAKLRKREPLADAFAHVIKTEMKQAESVEQLERSLSQTDNIALQLMLEGIKTSPELRRYYELKKRI
jgi:hypothetical protein